MKFKRLLVLLFVVSALTAPAALLAQVTVTGKITDSKTSLPLSGATIKVKNDRATAVSDNDGSFTIKAPSSESIISISYVGYTIYEVKAGDGNLSVQMVSTNSDLNEVVIVGYSTQKKVHLTGAITSIKGSEVEDLPVSNLGAALTGRLLGVGVSGGTSRPGSQAQLTVRNPLSLAKDGGNNNPLYIIDDVIQVTAQGANDATLFNNLDPSEVESISILKDGAAAVYGSRAANGAVLVRTKRGVNGKPRITYSGSYATNDEAFRTKMMSAYELARYINITNGPNGANLAAGPNNFFAQDELDHYKTINYDWLDMAWKSAYNMRHTLGLSGGSDKTTYFGNVTYYTQDGNLGRLEYGKWTYRAGVDATVASGLKVGLQVAGNTSKSTQMNSKIGGENIENDYRNLLRSPRYVPPYINGLPVKLPGPGGNNVASYHFFELNKLNNYIDDDQNTSTVNLSLEYEAPFLKGLRAKGSYARNVSVGRNQRIGTTYKLYSFNNFGGGNGHIWETATPINPPGNYSNDNSLRFFHTRSQLQQANFSLYYNKQIGRHSISVFGSVERSEAESTQEDVFKEGPSQLTNGQFNTAFGAIDGRTFAYEGGNLGYIGRVNYNYGSKYLGEFLFRTDASTKFAPDNYWGRFYSLSAGWVVTEEDFFKVKWIDFLKVRYSVGLLGKDDTRAWQWRQRYTFQNGKGGVFGGDNNPAGIGMKMEVSPNPDATWSDDFKQNLGIDARFLKNRLSSTIELFYNKGTNMLIERTGNVPVTVGGSIASQNWGAVNFFGVELGIGWSDNIGKDFNYGIDARISWNDNKAKQGNYNPIELQYPWNARPGVSTDIGKWGYDYLGMFMNQADIDAYVAKYNITSVFGTPVAQLRPGMLYYADVRGALQSDGTFAAPDGIIDDNDQVQLKKKASNHYGFGTSVKLGYKGINFEAVLAGSWGGFSEMDARSTLTTNISNLFQNGPSYWGDIYDPVLNPTGKYPNPWWDDISLSPTSDFWQVSSFRMRIVNASVSYTIPKKYTDAIKISNARVVANVLNPLNLFNPFGYRDPEASWDSYPVLRTISFGVNVTF